MPTINFVALEYTETYSTGTRYQVPSRTMTSDQKLRTWNNILCLFTCINFYVCHKVTYAFIQQIPHRNERLILSLSIPTSQENSEILKPTSSPQNTTCANCGKTFGTRNSLFRHLRNDEICSDINNSSSSKKIIPHVMRRDAIAILYSYDSYLLKEINFTSTNNPTDAESVGKVICNAFNLALEKHFAEYEETAKVIGNTQSSVAKLRVKALGLENGVSSTSDVLTLTYEYPVKMSLLDEKKIFQEEQRIQLFQRLKGDTMTFLSNIEENGINSSDHTKISNVCILSAIILAPDKKLHAESHCTQRVYHYLMPVKWIPGGNKIQQWWLENRKYENGRKGGQRLVARPPEEMRVFKDILRSFEGQRNKESSNNFDTSKNRFGNLASKPLRAWHNFADSTIRGAAVSPNNKPIWRSLDRCRIVKLIAKDDYDAIDCSSDNDDDNKVMVVIEFRGDDFIQQQVRRIVGASVAMANHMLPENFADIATRPDVFIESPLAPPNRMYQTRPRFHFDELSNKGRSMFHEEVDENDEVALTQRLHDRMIGRFIGQIDEEKAWLMTLKEKTANMRDQIKVYQDLPLDYNHSLQCKELLCPPEYLKTLTILQNIIKSNRWPSTSIARSRVIKEMNNNIMKSERQKVNQSGSFTIINPNYLSGILMTSDSGIKQPLGNELFPDLVEAVFELEEHLSKEMSNSKQTDKTKTYQGRPPSSHCAINCNAQFTPHVDSGRGCGQSLSMIVGLGSYIGGALVIEEDAFDINYKPLQFDGWRERHWTQQFQGERYSLVWFTPEMKGINDR